MDVHKVGFLRGMLVQAAEEREEAFSAWLNAPFSDERERLGRSLARAQVKEAVLERQLRDASR